MWEPQALTGTHFLKDTFYAEVTVDPQVRHEESPGPFPPVHPAHTCSPVSPLPRPGPQMPAPSCCLSKSPGAAARVPSHPARLPGCRSGRRGSRSPLRAAGQHSPSGRAPPPPPPCSLTQGHRSHPRCSVLTEHSCERSPHGVFVSFHSFQQEGPLGSSAQGSHCGETGCAAPPGRAHGGPPLLRTPHPSP